MPQLCTFGASSARGFGLTEETGPGLPDDQFNLTTLLLPGNGTNGAQNNTFLDSSTNNLTITRNGNTTQGTFSPFSFGGGTAQTDGYYSGYFDGSGDYLNKTSGTITLSGDFTLEYWMYPTSVGSYPTTYSTFNAVAATSAMYAQFALNGTTFTFSCGNGSSDGVIGSYTATLNQWQHHAIVRSGTTVTAYVNGVSVGTRTSSVAFNLTSLGIGAYTGALAGTYPFFGYISNFRVVNGTAVYTSNFAVPTTPLTNITNTSLLTCQSSQFIDNSTNAFAITPVGNSQPVPTNPFGMTDWSGYFDGTGDYLTFPELNIPSSTSFTIEFFVCWNAVPSTLSMFISEDGGNVSKYLTYNNNGTLQAQMGGNAGTVASCPFSLSSGVWYHIAFVRDTNTITIYVNGVAQTMTQATQSGAFLDVGTINYIGRWGGTTEYAFNGQMSNFRAVVGTAVYTANFTPPTAPLTAITNTQLLTCQSSTFIDNSPSARAITVNGNAYTGTLNNPFDSPVNYTTPPLQAWSNYFDGTGDYLSTTATAVGTNSFTVEAWVYPTAGSSYMGIYSSTEDTSGVGINLGIDNSNNVQGFVGRGNSGTFLNGTTPLSLNTWHHVAFVRNGSALSLYVNGTSVDSDTSSTSITATSAVIGRFYISYNGFYMNGYISNVRLVNGTAVYTSNFTVPTTPLTATQNTQLLTCQSNRFVDNSINRFAITRNGDTSVQAFSPFNPDAAYSTTSVGGSGYFDGTGDSLTIPGSSAFDFGTGNFTAEAWVYPMGASSDMSMIDFWIGGGGSYVVGQWQLTFYTSDTLSFVWASGSNTAVRITSPSSTLPKNTWTHIAVTRTGNLFQIFTNGVLGASTTLTQAMGTTSSGRIGIQTVNNAAPFTGYISGARILKGTSLYTTGFVPPAAPFTAVTNTQLLLNYTNAGILDATAKNVLETVGGAAISTAQSKWGGSSMSFDGSGDYLVTPAQAITNLTGDFTVEFWAYRPSAGNNFFYTTGDDALSSGISIYIGNSGNNLRVYNANGVVIDAALSGISFPTSTWTHIALVRSSGVVKLFAAGSQAGSNWSSSTTFSGKVYLATEFNNGSASQTGNCYLDDFRITNGYARYTANFTPPTAAFPTQ